MRVLVESERTLVVEARGRVAPCVWLALVALHLVLFYSQVATLFRHGSGAFACVMIAISLVAYVGLGYLALGPLRDKTTVTVHGLKRQVTIERSFPFNWDFRRNVAFSDIEQFEVSPPSASGFCRLALSGGEKVLLFRIGKDDDYSAIEKLDMITRKKVQVVS